MLDYYAKKSYSFPIEKASALFLAGFVLRDCFFLSKWQPEVRDRKYKFLKGV
ncbi:Uncharacterized protein dnm_016510 [Desulfonema magnum]|uniref:Uncharacterized protein n=1 Tax=Desulfonema magnum TaxID=45655 RepID=A0A975BHZ5_9BACT|nr:Uncharacterized protein dnm_016510 [Desulfonema magnum]